MTTLATPKTLMVAKPAVVLLPEKSMSSPSFSGFLASIMPPPRNANYYLSSLRTIVTDVDRETYRNWIGANVARSAMTVMADLSESCLRRSPTGKMKRYVNLDCGWGLQDSTLGPKLYQRPNPVHQQEPSGFLLFHIPYRLECRCPKPEWCKDVETTRGRIQALEQTKRQTVIAVGLNFPVHLYRLSAVTWTGEVTTLYDYNEE